MTHLARLADLRSEPFLHTTASGVIADELCASTLHWMETDAPWKLRIASFYEQWEMHLRVEHLPHKLQALCLPKTIEAVVQLMLAPLGPTHLTLNEVTAHKLVAGQTIRVHNDYCNGEETHRLIIQLNRGWSDQQGGLLMLFSSPSPDDVRRVIRPLHGSAMGFAITPHSFHAVSTIQSGERYTLVYSFRARSD